MEVYNEVSNRVDAKYKEVCGELSEPFGTLSHRELQIIQVSFFEGMAYEYESEAFAEAAHIFAEEHDDDFDPDEFCDEDYDYYACGDFG